MSNMSRNNSVNSLMGFSVHQPQLGAMLEFFPAMGSQQLDEMIDAYVPGNLSILDKRTAVTMEFFEHSMATGELFKFFMVTPATVAESPASSLQDSGYGSAFASPVVSEPRWSASTSKKARIGNARSAATPTADFSHIPGMKIMTRDGQDVTNAASRGCKTKEQRDHAHLMRIMKACESCKKKKVRCDPSHKRAAIPAVSDSKVKKASKKSASSSRTIAASVPPITTAHTAFNASVDTFMPSFDVAEQDSWEQFVTYDVDDFVAAPGLDVNYDFFYDPAGHFSPSASFASSLNSGSSSSSASPSQPFTPVQATVISSAAGLADGSCSKDAETSYSSAGVGDVSSASLPYMNSGEFDTSHYVDFALYSPQSTASLDDDLSSYSHELKAASSSPEEISVGGAHVQRRSVLRRLSSSSSSGVVASDSGVESRSAFAPMDQYGFDRGTAQEAQLISGVSHGQRRRVLSVGQNDKDSQRAMIASQDLSCSGMPRLDEPLVPRGQQDIPRPPNMQQRDAVAFAVRELSPVHSLAHVPPNSIGSDTNIRSTLQQQQSMVAAVTQSPSQDRMRPDGRVASSFMATEDCSHGVHDHGHVHGVDQESFVVKIANSDTTKTTTSNTMTTTIANTVTGVVQQTRATPAVTTIANHWAELVHMASVQRRLTTHVATQPVPAVTADSYSTPSSSHILEPHVGHAVSSGGVLPLSRSADSTNLAQSLMVQTTEAREMSTVLALVIIAVFTLSVVLAARPHVGLATILAMSATTVQSSRSLMKLRPTSPGPHKPTTTSSDASASSATLSPITWRDAPAVSRLGVTLRNIQSTLTGSTRKAGDLGTPNTPAALAQSAAQSIRQNSSFFTTGLVALR
ncbi:uncharacterized protein B0I36DRAFT_132471 [Microdochium trichocladiopsis]|uniref:Uncharacterized protein n=1 Tax=Microdochium trichocladiopsis TaxID=1682393 RepID=A0A9P8Y778_9PEZI|nr:uncharacterized protein B0I36DRAFT_132471 [Microdochium trichocladiopsis]KAH7029421.1 hypothetical protein B0I36DRAFT_132471 [Microdochium trichocladiopsis]